MQMGNFLQNLLLVLCIFNTNEFNIIELIPPLPHVTPQKACYQLFSGFMFPLAVLVPVWSEVHVAGVRLIDLNPNIGTDSDSENWTQTHRDVVNRYVSSTSSPWCRWYVSIWRLPIFLFEARLHVTLVRVWRRVESTATIRGCTLNICHWKNLMQILTR